MSLTKNAYDKWRELIFSNFFAENLADISESQKKSLTKIFISWRVCSIFCLLFLKAKQVWKARQMRCQSGAQDWSNSKIQKYFKRHCSVQTQLFLINLWSTFYPKSSFLTPLESRLVNYPSHNFESFLEI